MKGGRAYRIVIKYLHHSTDINEIRQEMFDLGHDVRNIVNAHHRITKEPLNLFFVDLAPAANNKAIYNITALQNNIILIEPPRIDKANVVHVPDVNSIVVRKHTAIDHLCESNVAVYTTAKTAPSIKIRPAKMRIMWRRSPSK